MTPSLADPPAPQWVLRVLPKRCRSSSEPTNPETKVTVLPPRAWVSILTLSRCLSGGRVSCSVVALSYW